MLFGTVLGRSGLVTDPNNIKDRRFSCSTASCWSAESTYHDMYGIKLRIDMRCAFYLSLQALVWRSVVISASFWLNRSLETVSKVSVTYALCRL